MAGDLERSAAAQQAAVSTELIIIIDNLLVRVHFIIVMIRWTGLLNSIFQVGTSEADLDIAVATAAASTHQVSATAQVHPRNPTP